MRNSGTRSLHSLFHPEGEHRFTICRLPIGASDYAEQWYSHNEVDGDVAMDHFSIERDFKYLIPYIKEALRYNPDLRLFASPWSPPTWMKFPKAYNYGTLRWEKEILEAYALYFVKFVEAYREAGITIHQVHVQNEVIADQKFPSCMWTGEYRANLSLIIWGLLLTNMVWTPKYGWVRSMRLILGKN